MSLKLLRWLSNFVAGLRRGRPRSASGPGPPEVDEEAVDRALDYPGRATDQDRTDDRTVLDRVLGRDAKVPRGRSDSGPPPG